MVQAKIDLASRVASLEGRLHGGVRLRLTRVRARVEAVTSHRVFTAEHLAAIALQTGRAKDKARLLQFIESAALDAARFQALLTRHGLMDAWQRFERQFLSDAP